MHVELGQSRLYFLLGPCADIIDGDVAAVTGAGGAATGAGDGTATGTDIVMGT